MELTCGGGRRTEFDGYDEEETVKVVFLGNQSPVKCELTQAAMECGQEELEKRMQEAMADAHAKYASCSRTFCHGHAGKEHRNCSATSLCVVNCSSDIQPCPYICCIVQLECLLYPALCAPLEQNCMETGESKGLQSVNGSVGHMRWNEPDVAIFRRVLSLDVLGAGLYLECGKRCQSLRRR